MSVGLPDDLGKKPFDGIAIFTIGKWRILDEYWGRDQRKTYLSLPLASQILRPSTRHCLRDEGLIVVKVPQAQCFVLGERDCAAYRASDPAYQAQTKGSLRRFIEAAGFTDIEISGAQRYLLSNSFYWLARGKPGPA